MVSGTHERILDVMQLLIQTRGYSAISYQSIADELGIRKASVHYHFATKEVLGIAVVERYREQINEMLESMADENDAWVRLDGYLVPFLTFGESGDRICLCGALAGESLALPDAQRELVAEFFDEHQEWLARLLSSGRKTTHFSFKSSPRQLARLTFSALQGALIVKRATGDAGQITDVVAELKSRIRG